MYASHLNQCSGSGSVARRDAVLLDAVEAAAVDLPRLAADARLARRAVLGGRRWLSSAMK